MCQPSPRFRRPWPEPHGDSSGPGTVGQRGIYPSNFEKLTLVGITVLRCMKNNLKIALAPPTLQTFPSPWMTAPKLALIPLILTYLTTRAPDNAHSKTMALISSLETPFCFKRDSPGSAKQTTKSHELQSAALCLGCRAQFS